MPDLSDILGVLHRQDAWGNSALHWLVALAAVLAIYLALRLLKAAVHRRAAALAQRDAGTWFHTVESVLQRTKNYFILVLAMFGGSCLLALPTHVSQIADVAVVIALLAQAALWGDALVALGVARYAAKNKDTDAASVTTLMALGFLGRLIIWAVAVLLAMSNFGVDITAMIAGLGIGGVAVALAAQNILGDLFASVSIVLDKPFVLGDFIVVDDKMGSIEYIGLKTTRLRSLSGEQLVFSNADLLKSRIHNYKRMHERRVLFTIGVTYETPYEQVAAIPAMLREIVESQNPVRFDRAHFARYGESALIFEVVYYVGATDYTTYMNVQQAVNLTIFRRFAEEDIGFAYPTRTLHLRGQVHP